VRELAAGALALAACGKTAAGPEADPAKVTALANKIVANVPVPGAARDCAYDDLMGGATLTFRTALELAGAPIDDKKPELAEWVNPSELDSPAARDLLGADDKLKRRAAAELLSAPFYLVYHVDLVDQPIPLGLKDFKRGHVGARALRYDPQGKLVCTYVFYWSQDPKKQEWAIKKSDEAMIDPAVAKEMQQDLRAQMLIRVAALAAPPPPRDPNVPPDDRSDRN